MQHRSRLIASLLSVCLGGAVCWLNQESAEKPGVSYRRGNTDSTWTTKSSQNSSADISGTHHVINTQTLKSDTVEHALPQTGRGLDTAQGLGLAVSQPGRRKEGQGTSASTPVVGTTSIDLGSDLTKAVSQSGDTVSPSSAREDTISSVHRSEGLISHISDSDGFTPPSSTSEGFTSLPTRSEDSKLSSHRGKHLTSPIPRSELITTSILGVEKLTSPSQDSEKLILRTTGSGSWKHRKTQNADFVNEVPEHKEWMNSTLSDEIKTDQDFMHAQDQNSDPMKKRTRNSEQEVHTSKYIEQTTPQDDGWSDPVPEIEDGDVKERLKATPSDQFTRWKSEEGMSEDGQSEHKTRLTTGKANVARFTENVTHKENKKDDLLRTTQQGGGLVRANMQNNDFMSTVEKGGDWSYIGSSGADTKDTFEKDRKHGRWKQHGGDFIDTPVLTTDKHVYTTQQDVQIVHTTEPVGHFVDTTTQDKEHTKPASQQLNQKIQKEGNFESSKLTTQPSDNTAMQHGDEFTRTSTQSALQANNPTRNQYSPDLTESETDKYLTFQIHYKLSSLPNMHGDDDVQTTVQDNGKIYKTTEAGTSFHAAQTSDELTYITPVNTDKANTSEQPKRRMQQTNENGSTNADNSEYKTYTNSVEAHGFPNLDDFWRKNDVLTTTQARQNRDMADTNHVREKLTESTPSSVYATNTKEESLHQWKSEDKIRVRTNYSRYSHVTKDMSEYNMAADNAMSADDKPWTRDTGGLIRSGNLNITHVAQDNRERNTAPAFGGQTVHRISTAKNTMGRTAPTKATNEAISTTVLTGSEKNDASTLGNNVATYTPPPQDNRHSSTPKTPPEAAKGTPKLTDHVANITPLAQDGADKATQFLQGNLATSTATPTASETYTTSPINAAQLLSGNTANTTPALRDDDVAINATQMTASMLYTTQVLTGNTGVKDTQHSAAVGPRDSLVTATTTTNVDTTARLLDVDCGRTASGLEDVYCSTTPAAGGGVTEGGVDKGMIELEPDTTTTIGATERGVVNTATTDRGVVNTITADNSVVNTAITERGVVNSATPDTDKVSDTTPLAGDYQDTSAAEPKDTADSNTEDRKDRLTDTALSKDEYGDNGSPQLEGIATTTTPPLAAEVTSTAPPVWGSITSSDNLHPQTTNPVKSETNTTKQTKRNQDPETLNSEDLHHQGQEAFNKESTADLMEADQPDTSLSSTLLTDHSSADEDKSEPRKEVTKPDSAIDTRSPQSRSQEAPSNETSRSILVNSDSQETNTEPGMSIWPSEDSHQENRSALPWENTRTEQENLTPKPWPKQTDTHTSEANQPTTAQGSEYPHSHAQETSVDKDQRSTNSEQLTGSNEPTKESLDHNNTDAHLTDSISYEEKEHKSSIVDSYLTSHKYLLRNTKTLPEFNTETINSLKKTTETASEVSQQNTGEETGEASNPLVTSSRDVLDDSSHCPACNGASREVKDTDSKELMTGGPSRDWSVSSAGPVNAQTWPELLPPTTTFSWTSSEPSTPTRRPTKANKPTSETPLTQPRNTRTPSGPDLHSAASFSVSKLDQMTTSSTKVPPTMTPSTNTEPLMSSAFLDKISTFTTGPASNVGSTSSLSSSKKSPTNTASSSTVSSTITPLTSEFEFRTSRPTSVFGLSSSLSTFKPFPTTKIRSPTTDAAHSTTPADSSVPLSTVTRSPFTRQSASTTLVTSRTQKVTPREQSNLETARLTHTARPLTKTTQHAESTSRTRTLATTQTSTDRDDQTSTSILPWTLTSKVKTTPVTFTRSPSTTYPTTATETATETSSSSTTTLGDTTSRTATTVKTTNVTKQTQTATPTTVTPSPRPTTTTGTTTATTTATTAKTTQTEMTTREPTTTSPLELGDFCVAPPSTKVDACTTGVLHSACRDGRCVCVWPTRAYHGICVQYFLTNPAIRVSHVAETTITIMWSAQAFSDVRSVMYKVSWEASRGSTGGAVAGSPRVTPDTVYVIDQLTAGTEYNISVAAILVGQDNERNPLLLYFSPAVDRTVPSQVGNMNWSLSSDKTTVTLTFDRPRGYYDHCQLVVRHMTWDGTTDSSDPVRRFDCLTVNLSPFEVGIWHKIDVTVVSGNVSGQMSTFNLTTPATAPGLVTSPAWTTTDHSALVTWRPPHHRHGYISGYDLALYTDGACVRQVQIFVSTKQNLNTRDKYPAQDGGNSRECKFSKVESVIQSRNASLAYTFTDLEPGRQYTLELSAQNRNLNGEVTRVSMTTFSAVPKPPSDVRVEEVTSSSIMITWKPPEYPGPTNYLINVFKNRLKDDAKFVKNMTVFGHSSTTAIVTDLQHYSTYWLNVSAVTSAGQSRAVILGPVVTLQKVSDPVSRLKIHEITAHTVSLNWGHPRNVFGHLSAYIVFVQPESSPGKCQRVIILSEKKGFQVNQTVCSPERVVHVHLMTLLHSTSIDFSVTDLQPYTTYNVSVAAVNGAGLGRLSAVTLSTSIAVPPAPRGQKCTSPGRGTITFSWGAPALTTGPTTYFVVVSKSKHVSDLSQGLQFFGNFTVPESGDRSLNLSGLQDFWLYSFSMSAQTAAGSSKMVTLDPPCRTSSAPPGPVKGIQIGPVNATSAQLLWRCPREEDRHGVIDRFVISQRVQMFTRIDLDADSEVAETLTLKARPQSCSRTYNVTVKVVPELTYIFQIQAKVVGIDQPGDPLSQVFTAPADVPKPIVALPTSEPYTDESSLKETSFSASICVSCLLDNSHGKIYAFGILVCQEGFCDQSLGDLHDWRSAYSGMATWRSAHSKQFETVYRATDRSWELQLQARPASSPRSEVIFEVGNDTSCANKPGNVYCNGPLPAGKSFRVRLFSCTTAGCSVSEPSGLFMTAESDSQPTSDSVVIGGAVAGIAVAVVVLAVVIGVRLKFRDPKIKGGSSKSGSQEMTQVVVVTNVPSVIITDTSRPIRLGDYDKTLRVLHMNDNAALSQEYAELNQRSPQHSVDVGSDLAFRHDNRWTNILPFDHSRVKLAVLAGDDACAHDYINANYISGLDSGREYIATQGPLTRTVPDFWRMIWEQNVTVIVMLSDLEELDKRTQVMREKVARYFPGDEETGSCQYGLIQVSRTRKDYNHKWEIRTLKLTHMRARKVRILKHFFFKNWSDHEADIDTRELIDFVEVLRAEMKSLPKAPLVVHCSAGVGRTGTFIAVHYFYKLLSSMRSTSGTPGLGAAANKTVDIFGRVLKLRDCRRFMVQSMSQYIFVYDAVQEIIQRVFQLTRSKDYDICEKKGNQSLNILTCPGSLEDTVYDDVELLQGQVTADRACETATA